MNLYMPVMDPKIHPYMSTPKIQICDDLMIVANGNCLEFLHGPAPEHYEPAPGFKDFIYRIVDISDPEHPVEAGRWWNPGQFVGNQTEKTRAKEWHGWQGHNAYPGYVHFPFADTDKNLTYISCVGAGFKILDISDPQVPQVLGEVKMTPPFSTKFGGALCHTFMPINGTKYAVGMQEGERFWCYDRGTYEHFGTHSYCGIEMFDVSDPADPVMVAVFPYPEIPENFPYKNFNICGMDYPGPFGSHNLHKPMTHKPWIEDRSDRVYDCYFHAGLRVYDVSDPYVPREIAYFIPPNPEKLCFDVKMANKPLGTAEDLVVDDRGYICLNTMHDGVYILRVTDGV